MSDSSARCAAFRHDRIAAALSSVREDVQRFASVDPRGGTPSILRSVSILLQPSLLCLLTHRVAHCLWVRGWRRMGRAISRLNLALFKADLHPQSCIGPGCFLGHTVGTCFVGSAGRNLTLYALATCCPPHDAPGDIHFGPFLGDDVTISGQATVIGPVRVGPGATVGPKTWLDRDCPPAVMAVSTRLRHASRPRGAASGRERQSSKVR